MTLKINPTVQRALRLPKSLDDWFLTSSQDLGYRSVQEYILQVLRDHRLQAKQPRQKQTAKAA